MNKRSFSLTTFWFLPLIFCQSVSADVLSISNQDLINMVQNSVPELENDCLNCKNKKEKDLGEKLKEKINLNWKTADIPKFCDETAKNGIAKDLYQMSDEELQIKKHFQKKKQKKNGEVVELKDIFAGAVSFHQILLLITIKNHSNNFVFSFINSINFFSATVGILL